MPKTRSSIKPPSVLAVEAPPSKRVHPKRAPVARSVTSVNRRLRQIEDKRAAILRAALGLFSRFGLHGTSVDQVAARADVSKSNLLYYFANKEELYVSVLRELLAVRLERCAASAPSRTRGRRLATTSGASW